MLAATEITDGVFYPVGGFRKVRVRLLGFSHRLDATAGPSCRLRQASRRAGLSGPPTGRGAT